MFLGISKAFNKVWHKGLPYKLKFYGDEDELLSLLERILEIENKELF